MGAAPGLVDVGTGQQAGPAGGLPIAASGEVMLVIALDAFRASASARGIVTAVDRRTGAPLWTKNLGANLFSVDADTSAVAVAAGPIPDPGTELGQLGGVEVLDPATGQRRWAAPLMPAYGVALAGGHVVFQNLDRLRGVDAATGQTGWDVAVPGLLDTAPNRGGTLLAVQGGGGPSPGGAMLVAAFDAASGAPRWEHRASSELLNPGIVNDRVVAVANAGTDRRVRPGDRAPALAHEDAGERRVGRGRRRSGLHFGRLHSVERLSRRCASGGSMTYDQNWYAVCLASEIDEGAVVGADVLGGRVAVYRRSDGAPVVLSAACPHMGADLAGGDVLRRRPALHVPLLPLRTRRQLHRHPVGGQHPAVGARCTASPSPSVGDSCGSSTAPSRSANYRGSATTTTTNIVVRARRTDLFPVEPWVIMANSFDYQHLRFVHGFEFEFDEDHGRLVGAVPDRGRHDVRDSPRARRSSRRSARAGPTPSPT